MQDKSRKELRTENLGELTAASAELVKLHTEVQRSHRRTYIEYVVSFTSVLFSLGGAIAASLGVSLSFSTLPQIPKPYVYLVGVIVSSLAGISIIFLLARRIYQQRKKERMAAIEGIRTKEDQLFKLLRFDFESMLRTHNLDAEPTVRTR